MKVETYFYFGSFYFNSVSFYKLVLYQVLQGNV